MIMSGVLIVLNVLTDCRIYVPGYKCELGHGVSKLGMREWQESERKTLEINFRFDKIVKKVTNKNKQ